MEMYLMFPGFSLIIKQSGSSDPLKLDNKLN